MAAPVARWTNSGMMSFLKGFGIKEGDPVIVGRQNTHGAQG